MKKNAPEKHLAKGGKKEAAPTPHPEVAKGSLPRRLLVNLKYNPLLQASLAILIGAAVAGAVLYASRGNAPLLSSSRNLSECLTTSDFKCYEGYLQDRVMKSDPKVAFADIKTEYDTNAYVKSQCHQLSHVIGRTAYKKYGSLGSAFPKGDAFCWSGYHHGIVEEAIGDMGAEKIKTESNTVCKELADKERFSFDHYNCVHGLGHGFMTVESYDLFKTLKTCDLLSDSWDRTSCYGGAYMENVMIEARGDGKSKFLRPEEPMYPCTAVDYNYKQQCYAMQTSYILQQNGYDFAKAFVLCRDVADDAFVATCYESIGRDASGSTVSDITRTIANCRHATNDTGLTHCMLGAVRDFVSYHHSDVQALELCKAFGGNLQARCSSEVATYYSTF